MGRKLPERMSHEPYNLLIGKRERSPRVLELLEKSDSLCEEDAVSLAKVRQTAGRCLISTKKMLNPSEDA
jgi:hypothetical protein